MASLVHPVILSGGTGTRLWPLSRTLRPKQLLQLTSDRSMLQETVDRVGADVPCSLDAFPECLAAVPDQDQLAEGRGVAQRRDDCRRQVGEVEDVLAVKPAAVERRARKGLKTVGWRRLAHSVSRTTFFSPVRRCATQAISASMAGPPAAERGWLMKTVTAMRRPFASSA